MPKRCCASWGYTATKAAWHSSRPRSFPKANLNIYSNFHGEPISGLQSCRDVQAPVWPKYPNALLFHRLRLYHDSRFTLNCMTLSPILIIYGRRLCRGDRGMDWKKLRGSITESVDEELRLRNAYLVAENRILRQQINGRVQLTDSDRKTLAELGQKTGRQALEEIATVAKAATILAWHRKCVNQTVATSVPHKSVGRPHVDQEIESLVVQMAQENRSWGYDRIVGALLNLGYTISD